MIKIIENLNCLDDQRLLISKIRLFREKIFCIKWFFLQRVDVGVDDLENQSFEKNGDFKKSVFSKFQ